MRAAAGLDVEMAGAIGDTPTFLRQLDVFALVSDHEGTPAALLEAMACGCACIATDTGGMPAALGDAGVLVPLRNPVALSEALAALMDDADRRTRLRHRAAARSRLYALSSKAQEYAELYHESARC